MSNKKLTKPNFTLYLKVFWGIVLLFILSIFAIFFMVNKGVFGDLPTFEDLETPEKNFATQIISADGELLGTYAYENRKPVKFKDLPNNLIKALVATEDERFYEHSGIDVRGTLRAVVKMGKGGGASTITQQLAKLIFHKRENASLLKKIGQKLKEWVIAIKLEKQYTKDEIITMYFNKFDFLYRAIGIRSAANIYFSKEPKDLSIEESAVLVAMLKNPRQYNPKRKISKKKSLLRRNQVFVQMQRSEFITEKEKDSLQKLPLKLDYSPQTNNDGHATYFREYLREYLRKWVKNNPKADGTYYNLYADGLKIFVTLDSRMQTYAEEAVQEHMSNLQRIFFKEQKHNPTAPFYDVTNGAIDTIMYKSIRQTQRYRTLKKDGLNRAEIIKSFKSKKREMNVFDWKQGSKDTLLTPYDSIRYYKTFLHTGLLSIEPQTGNIKAWVGDINHKYFKYDHVRQGARQVGSTFKPFVYASAINQFRISPCEKYPNTPYTISAEKYGMEKDWTPKNAGNKYGGELTLKQALAKSVNVITAQLVDKVGPATVARLAKKSGIPNVPAYPSIALGTIDASLYNMVGAYAMFANEGFRVHQNMILRIEDRHGSVLQRFVPQSEEVMSEEAAYAVLDLLKGVTLEGSGVRLRGKNGVYKDSVATGYPYQFTNPIAGKTGTTQNQSDGWFMGVVPNLATGVWTGGDDRSTHFEGITFGQGASMSLPTWALFMKKCYADESLFISQEDFERPKNFGIAIDCESLTTDGETPLIETDPDF